MGIEREREGEIDRDMKKKTPTHTYTQKEREREREREHESERVSERGTEREIFVKDTWNSSFKRSFVIMTVICVNI